jgi:hypothetical protein
MIPPALQVTLDTISKKYGLPLNLNEVDLTDNLPEKIKATRKIVDLVKGNSKLLPELLKLTKSLLKAELKLADFHKKLAKEAIRFNEQMDKATADIFLAMAGYKARSAKIEHRTNVRVQLKERRQQAYANYYQNSVFGSESALIDTEMEVLASNQAILTEARGERITFESERRQKLQEYVNSAYQN